MTTKLESLFWMDDLGTARSVPLDGLGKLAESNSIMFAGELVEELAAQLGLELLEPPALKRLDAWHSELNIGYVAKASHLKNESRPDFFVNLDRRSAGLLCTDLDYLRTLRANVRKGCIFPARLAMRTVSVSWGEGFSWAESDGETYWTWCHSKSSPRAEMVLLNSLEGPLVVQLAFDTLAVHRERISVKLQLNGRVVADLKSAESARVKLELQRGKNDLVWTTDASPLDLGGRLLSFGVRNLEIQDHRGASLLSRELAYGKREESGDALDDLLLRSKLHEAGFLSIAGVLRNQMQPDVVERLCSTTGSPSLPRPFDVEHDAWYGGSLCGSSDVAWFFSSPLTGAGFTEILNEFAADA